MSRTITATNIGPVPQVVISLPEKGGVVELLGRNGQGKSTVLEAAERLLGVGKSPLSNRDGTTRGTLEGLGIKISVSKGASRRTGDLEVVGLEHRLDLAKFIDPQIDSPDAADRKRIAALMVLSGVVADATRFHRLAGGAEQFAKLVDSRVEKMTDVVEIAKTVKLDLERAARTLESQSERESGEAAGAAGTTEGIDMDAESDSATLDHYRDEAVAAYADLLAKRKSAAAVQSAAADARAKLEQSQQSGLPSVEDARQSLAEAQEAVRSTTDHANKISEAIVDLQKALDKALGDKYAAENEAKHAFELLKAAEHREKSLAGWNQAIHAAESLEMPTDEQIDLAADKVVRAKAAVEQGVLIRNARRAKLAADKHRDKAIELTRQALLMRDAARQTDEVLSEFVNVPGLSVDGGRLMCQHPIRGRTFFGELSVGERSRIALELGVSRVGRGGVLVLPQEFWEGLDPINRQEIDSIARELGVTVITARSDVGEIRSRIVGEPEVAAV